MEKKQDLKRTDFRFFKKGIVLIIQSWIREEQKVVLFRVLFFCFSECSLEKLQDNVVILGTTSIGQ